VGEKRSASEGGLEFGEGVFASGVKDPWSVFAGESGEQNYDVGVSVNEMSIEVAETKEGLNIFDFAGCRPVGDGLNLLGIHRQASRGQDKA
jgi:hypothetical protein